MRRSLLVILSVAAISAWFARGEHAPDVVAAPVAHASLDDWVRTSAGWERRSALVRTPRATPTTLHPGLLAGFQLTASLLVLAAFPGRAVPRRATAPAPAPHQFLARHAATELSASR